MADTLTALDGVFLRLEELDAGALMNLGGVMVFDPPDGGVAPTVEVVREHLAARLGQIPRYSQRLSSARTGSLAWPRWVPDERFDIRRHVGHNTLPAPGDETQLSEWTAEFFSRPLERTRPLWEMMLVEGLERGRWALGWKTHHCLVDGVVAVELIGLLLGPAPTARTEPASPSSAPGGPSWRSRVPQAVVQTAEAGARAGSAAVRAAAHPRETLSRSREVAQLIVRDELRRAPRTSLTVPIGQSRRYAVVRAPTDELKAIGRHLDASLTDVVLAASTGACEGCCSRARRNCRRAGCAPWCLAPGAMHRTDRGSATCSASCSSISPSANHVHRLACRRSLRLPVSANTPARCRPPRP